MVIWGQILCIVGLDLMGSKPDGFKRTGDEGGGGGSHVVLEADMSIKLRTQSECNISTSVETHQECLPH